MHRPLARILFCSSLTGAAYAEALQFPDPNTLPPAVRSTQDIPANQPAAPSKAESGTPDTSGYTYPPSNQPTSNKPSATSTPTTPASLPTMPTNIPGFGFPSFTWQVPPAAYPYPNPSGNAAIGNAPPVAQQLTSLYQSLAELRQQQAQLVSKTEEALAAKDKSLQGLTQQLADSNRAKGELESKLTALQTKTTELEQQLLTATQQKTELESKLTALQTELATQKEQNAATSQQQQAMATQLAALQAELAAIRQQANTPDKATTAASPADTEEKPATVPAALDTDKDGVSDDTDLCPSTATGATINAIGCTNTETINLKGVTFETGSAVLTAESLPILDKIANAIKQHPTLKIEVGGHTDSSGDKAANEKLSQSRAEAVMRHLIAKGVPAGSLSAKGYGAAQPLADNNTADGKKQNRRVELKVLP